MFSNPAAYRSAGRQGHRVLAGGEVGQVPSFVLDAQDERHRKDTILVRFEVEEAGHDVRPRSRCSFPGSRPFDQRVDAHRDGRGLLAEPQQQRVGALARRFAEGLVGVERRRRSVGISSDDSIERMTSRIASVATTRTMFRRAASCVAIVDLPTPVVPPIRITSGTSSSSTSRHRRRFFA